MRLEKTKGEEERFVFDLAERLDSTGCDLPVLKDVIINVLNLQGAVVRALRQWHVPEVVS